MEHVLSKWYAHIPTIYAKTAELLTPWPDLAFWRPPLRFGELEAFHYWDVFPFLFLDHEFPTLRTEDVILLAAIGRCFAWQTLLVDDVVDRDCFEGPMDRFTTYLLDSLRHHEAAYSGLTLLFPPNDLFWRDLSRHSVDYRRALLLEEWHIANPYILFEEDEYRQIAVGKQSLARACPCALAALSNSQGIQYVFESALDHLHVATQLYDDLRDWRSDLARGRLSWVLNESRRLDSRLAKSGDPESYRDTIFLSGIMDSTLERAISELDSFDSVLTQVNAPDLQALGNAVRLQLGKLHSDLIDIRSRPQPMPQSLEHSTASAQEPFQSAVDLFLKMGRDGFADAEHTLAVVTDNQGDTSFVSGRVFMDALIGETLVDLLQSPHVRSVSFADRKEAIAQLQTITDRVLAARQPDPVGAWTYFRNLPGLPPDSDTFAQVARFLLRQGHAEAQHLLEAPLASLLGQHPDPTGAISTWILPPESDTRQTVESELHRLLRLDTVAQASVLEARRADPEVCANVLLALLALKSSEFGPWLQAGARFVETCQDPKGFWSSSWYCDPFYATWICVKCLASLDQGTDARIRTQAFLHRSQRPDGGWGTPRSNPLSTALAVLTLHDCPKTSRREDALSRALSYLRGSVHGVDSDVPPPFIRIVRTTASSDLPGVIFRSKCVTVAFMLKALLLLRANHAESATPNEGRLP